MRTIFPVNVNFGVMLYVKTKVVLFEKLFMKSCNLIKKTILREKQIS